MFKLPPLRPALITSLATGFLLMGGIAGFLYRGARDAAINQAEADPGQDAGTLGDRRPLNLTDWKGADVRLVPKVRGHRWCAGPFLDKGWVVVGTELTEGEEGAECAIYLYKAEGAGFRKELLARVPDQGGLSDTVPRDVFLEDIDQDGKQELVVVLGFTSRTYIANGSGPYAGTHDFRKVLVYRAFQDQQVQEDAGFEAPFTPTYWMNLQDEEEAPEVVEAKERYYLTQFERPALILLLRNSIPMEPGRTF